jgi:transcriptional regulator with XRE-family HTH domain
VAGEILKKRREELGLSIKDVSSFLRIKAEYLSSIEEDQFEKLPLAVYTIGYIRCYAAHLHVDPEPILSTYSGHLSYPQPPAVLPVSTSKKKVPFYQYLVILAVLLLVALTIFISTQQDYTTDTPVKALSVPAQPIPVEKPQQAPTVQEDQPPVPLPQAVTQAPAIPIQPPVSTAAAPGHRIEITAHEHSWMKITFSGGVSEEVLLNPGMVKTWTFPDTAVLKIGNAGGVKLGLDGRDIGTPGSKGQVMTIAFPENRQIVKEPGVAEQQ